MNNVKIVSESQLPILQIQNDTLTQPPTFFNNKLFENAFIKHNNHVQINNLPILNSNQNCQKPLQVDDYIPSQGKICIPQLQKKKSWQKQGFSDKYYFEKVTQSEGYSVLKLFQNFQYSMGFPRRSNRSSKHINLCLSPDNLNKPKRLVPHKKQIKRIKINLSKTLSNIEQNDKNQAINLSKKRNSYINFTQKNSKKINLSIRNSPKSFKKTQESIPIQNQIIVKNTPFKIPLKKQNRISLHLYEYGAQKHKNKRGIYLYSKSKQKSNHHKSLKILKNSN